MNVPERIAKLRSLMEEKGIDIYVVPTADFHQSEYVGEHFKARKFITGFSGSAGTAVITKTGAYLWTDGRYYLKTEYSDLTAASFPWEKDRITHPSLLRKTAKLFTSTI